MAKKSLIARDVKRKLTIERFAKRRGELKAIIQKGDVTFEERFAALQNLQKLPRDASPSRLQTRCNQCGRPHAVYRKFKLCRIHLREALMQGYVPGGRKSSW